MSRAFVKEQEDAAELPDRPVSPHPNLVTPRGLALIDAEVESARKALAQAQQEGDRAALSRASRDLRYWAARRASAQVIAPAVPEKVGFGHRVTLEREDGRTQSIRIVGEDEADPAAGSVSYVAPVARALLGRCVGDEVELPGGTAVILAIEV
jgi:transcription elongation GreA/GreB family factor